LAYKVSLQFPTDLAQVLCSRRQVRVEAARSDDDDPVSESESCA
jgi:hypothetical protein